MARRSHPDRPSTITTNSPNRFRKRRPYCFVAASALLLGLTAVTATSFADDCDYYEHPCAASPMTYGSGIIEGRVAPASTQPADFNQAFTRGQSAAVAIDDSEESANTFLVTWVSDLFIDGCLPIEYEGSVSYEKILVARFDADGECLSGPRTVSGLIQFADPVITGNTTHATPSIAITSHEVRVAWTGVGSGNTLITDVGAFFGGLLVADFDETDDPSTWPVVNPTTPTATRRNYSPSAGLSYLSSFLRTTAYTEYGPTGDVTKTLRVARTPGSGITAILDSTDCAGGSVCGDRLQSFWQPCIATDQGYSVVVWTHAESPLDNLKFNIHLDMVDSSGTRIIGGDGIIVNDTTIEANPSIQFSAAVDFFGSDVIVVWNGDPLPNPCNQFHSKVFARRFKWAGGATAPYPISPEFIINAPPAVGHNPTIANPTVAISREGNGRWIAAWTNNAGAPSGSADEIRAQYFENGRPMGANFRVNQDTTTNGYLGTNVIQRRLANSNQHTIRYGREGEVVCVWTAVDYPIPISPYCCRNNNQVYFTRLPAGYADTLDTNTICCKGDMDGYGSVNLVDVPLFVATLLGNTGVPRCLDIVTGYPLICPADCNEDGVANGLDVQMFVERILAGATCTAESRSLADCNGNEIPDANDIADGTSLDCNHNFIPDECDINTEDPDGNELVSADVNANSVPDECEPDCNVNSIPDAWDITQMTSADVNTNGIPDECEPDCNNNNYPDDYDIAMSTSADCNANAIPDECEIDCNSNGVPDDCDINPLDPDGNEEVSNDCNEDRMPDECNLALPPPYGSFDCNENGTLDECDIASEYSDDANENGVPDECEEEALRAAPNGGRRLGVADSKSLAESDDASPGVSTMIQGPGEETWEAFYEWSFSQCWGLDCEATTGEQFQAYVNKLAELGITMP